MIENITVSQTTHVGGNNVVYNVNYVAIVSVTYVYVVVYVSVSFGLRESVCTVLSIPIITAYNEVAAR